MTADRPHAPHDPVVVEAMARAIYEADEENDTEKYPWRCDAWPPHVWDCLSTPAEAALDAQLALPASARRELAQRLCPEGWKLVPKVLTEEMRRATWRAQYEHVRAKLHPEKAADVGHELAEAKVNDAAQAEQDQIAFDALLAAAPEPSP